MKYRRFGGTGVSFAPKPLDPLTGNCAYFLRVGLRVKIKMLVLILVLLKSVQ